MKRARPVVDAGDETRAGLPIRTFASAARLETWLRAQPAGSKGFWLKLAKQGASVASVSKAEAIEVALCHGWIDGQLNPYDEHFWLVRFTPRSAKSRWSEINRATATRLMAEGRVSEAGLAQIEAARRDGRWGGAYAPQSRAEVPADLQAALDSQPAARAFFATLTGANRYAVLYRIQDARTPATRQARIDQFVAMLARGEVLHPPRPKDAGAG
ncbi:YdeI/OmpD-associated family protein [Piscinibacter sakaiensis]|uniref:Putative periplasmic membrane protein n=1 Tax=Piscinibacter sakaiensis TaxID=1547922 RepID=A0A0K8P349_PISS1|nr:YdeI/OmpD-associated family protein [Piscinibacter sakaiensis]GAP37038.1 putative periplasmic membrane protein [Piscinibacter sakaiensis]